MTGAIRSSVLAVGILIPALSGCASIGKHWHAKVECKKEQHAAKQELKDAVVEQELEQCKLETQAELERAKLQLERCKAEWEQELARQRACVELHREQLQQQYQERLRSQLALNFDQRVEVGQLQVNAEELKKLIEEREQEHKEISAVYERLEDARRAKLREQMLAAARQALEAGDTAKCQALMHSCACGQYAALNDCAQPISEKLQEQAQLRESLKRPILPTEIPLMLPIKLNVEMANPTIEQAHVQRLMIRESLKQCAPCPQCASYSPQCPQCQAQAAAGIPGTPPVHGDEAALPPPPDTTADRRSTTIVE